MVFYHKILIVDDENEKLTSLAKMQNKKLYTLNCKLMETKKQQNELIHKLDAKILLLKKQNPGNNYS